MTTRIVFMQVRHTSIYEFNRKHLFSVQIYLLVHILSELPGISKENIQLTVDDDFLNIVAWRKEEHDTREWKTHRKELNYGKVERRFKLPEDIDVNKITSIFENGLLHLCMKKKGMEEQKEVKRLTIN